jgi:hypothetical protein
LLLDRHFASIGFKTTTVAVALSQFAGLTFNPVDGLASQLVGDAVRTTGVAATVTIPLASMLNGPVVNGVTLVLVVAAGLLNVSFVNAFNAVTTVLFDATVTDGSFTASGLFTQLARSGIAICWAYIQSC